MLTFVFVRWRSFVVYYLHRRSGLVHESSQESVSLFCCSLSLFITTNGSAFLFLFLFCKLLVVLAINLHLIASNRWPFVGNHPTEWWMAGCFYFTQPTCLHFCATNSKMPKKKKSDSQAVVGISHK